MNAGDDVDYVEMGGPDPCPPSSYGWKASRIHALLVAGFPTVAGIVLAASEHVRHLDENDLEPSATEAQVRNTFLSARVKLALNSALAAQTCTFAVRSSSASEDQSAQSLAGRYVSMLDVSITEIGAAVIAVWASAHKRESPDDVAFTPIAVIVQPMLSAEAYGVASNVDPVTGRDVVVVEAGATPAAVTAGSAVLERYEVSADRDAEAVPQSGGVMTALALNTLAKMVRAISSREGAPYEVEFGSTSGEIRLLQARPIAVATALPPPPTGNWVLDPGHYPRPLTTLFESLFAPLVADASEQAFLEYGVFVRCIELRSIHGWPYVRAKPLSDMAAPSLPGSLIGAIARLHPRLRSRVRTSASALAHHLPDAHVRHWEDLVEPEALEFIRQASDLDVRRASGHSLKYILAAAVEQLKHVLLSNYQTDFAHLIPLARFVWEVRQNHDWTDAKALALVRGQARPQALYPAALEHLASRLSQSSAVLDRLREGSGRPLKWIVGDDEDAAAAWREHSRRWGLTLLGYDLDEPSIREAPELERQALVAILAGAGARRMKDADSGAAGLTTFEVELLDNARRRFHLREEGESVKAAVLGAIRAVALEVGRRLHDTGKLPEAELTLFLTLDELSTACVENDVADLSQVLARQRARREALRRVPLVELGRPAVRNPDLTRLPRPSREVHQAVALLAQNEILPGVVGDSGSLRGRAASAGVHTGRVRVLTDPARLAAVEAGEVVVAPSVSSLWSSGFWTAGALVTEAGGLLSHSAIVAREMGIPAVVGVQGATKTLKDGEIVTVDGANGVVRRHASA